MIDINKVFSSFTRRFVSRFFLLAALSWMLGSCSSVSVPEFKVTHQPAALNTAEIKRLVSKPPLPSDLESAEYSPIPSQPVEMPKAGDTTPLGVKVTEELALAFNSYLGGDGEKALSALASLSKTSHDPAVLWQASFLRVQILLMMGRAATAEEELENTTRLEIAHFGSDLNALALKGEVKIWLEDYDSALQDFARIIKRIDTWELPIHFRSFPTNRQSLYYLTTAKLRAYTGIAGVYVFKEDYLKALDWSREAERLYNNAHFVVNHPLYGMNDEVHADNYYGRAMNLTFLASATLAVTGDIDAAETFFQKADGFYQVLGYTVGQITVAALKARVFNRLGMHDRCYAAGQYAISLAIEHGMPDYVWRVGVLSGITLYEKGLIDEAERMFRQAQDAVDTISGNLSSDRSKIRFGVGKNDIVHHLARIDIRKQNMELLFADLERARARSFVDLLADQALAKDREGELVSEIRDLESRILKQRLLNMAPGAKNPDGIQQALRFLKAREETVARLRERDPELAELVSISHSSLNDVQQALQNGETIAYAVPGKRNDAIQFLLITADSASIRQLDLTYDNVSQLIENFAEAFELGDVSRGIQLTTRKTYSGRPVTEESAISDIQQAFKLSDWSVRNKLYMVPSADLYFIPWGVLETPFPVISLPTGSWITRRPRQLRHEREIVIVGDPDFGGELPQLPGARQEAIAVGKIYQAQPLLGQQAREASLRDQVGRGVGIIHLATHGIFRTTNPLESAVFLSSGGKADALTADRIYKAPLPASLVILSACETGLGKTIAGDDLLGLTRSFYLGGAVSTLSSLWQIEDEGTMAFMTKFHQLAITGDYGNAWVAARNYVKAQGYPASVYAAFVLGGASR